MGKKSSFPTGAGRKGQSGSKPFGGLKQNDNRLGLTGVGAPSWGLKALGIGNTSIGTNPSAPLGVKNPSNPLGEKACNVKNPSTSLGVNICDGKNLSTSLGVNTCDGKNPSTSNGDQSQIKWLLELRGRSEGMFSDKDAQNLFGFEEKEYDEASEKEGMIFLEPRDFLLMFYYFVLPYQDKGIISIIMIKDFLSKVKVDYPEFIPAFLEYCYGNKSKEIINVVEGFFAKFRRPEYVIQFSSPFKMMLEAVKSKLLAPANMTLLEMANWLKFWIFIAKDQHVFGFDLDIIKDCARLNQMDRFVLTTVSFMEYRKYFETLSDGEIIQELLEKMVKLFPEPVQNVVLKYCGIIEDEATYFNVRTVRQNVKRLIFPFPWCSPSSIFCTRSGIKSIDERYLKAAVEAYRDNVFDTLPTFDFHYFSAYENERGHMKRKTGRIYAVGIRGEEKTYRGVSCKEEIKMYVEVYKWLLGDPDFKFGTQQKTLKEYGLDKLLEQQTAEISEETAACTVPVTSEKSEAYHASDVFVASEPEKLTEAQALVEKYGALVSFEVKRAAKWIDNPKSFSISEFEEMLVLMEETLKIAAKNGCDDTVLEEVLQEDFICILLLRTLKINLKELNRRFGKTHQPTVTKVRNWCKRYADIIG